MVESVSSSNNNNVFGLIGTKIGMSRVFGSDGESIPVTVINIGLNVVSSLRSSGKHGYSDRALDLASGGKKRPLTHCRRWKMSPILSSLCSRGLLDGVRAGTYVD